MIPTLSLYDLINEKGFCFITIYLSVVNTTCHAADKSLWQKFLQRRKPRLELVLEKHTLELQVAGIRKRRRKKKKNLAEADKPQWIGLGLALALISGIVVTAVLGILNSNKKIRESRMKYLSLN